MKKLKKLTVMEIILFFYVLFLLVLSVSMIFMPYREIGSLGERGVIILAATVFWAGLAGTLISGFIFCLYRKKNSPGNKKSPAETIKRSGIINFFGNPFAAAADILMIISLVILIISAISGWNIYVKSYIIAVFIFSFGMHCMLNGINFKFILFQKKNRRGNRS